MPTRRRAPQFGGRFPGAGRHDPVYRRGNGRRRNLGGPPDSPQVLSGVKSLLERGARRIVVSLSPVADQSGPREAVPRHRACELSGALSGHRAPCCFQPRSAAKWTTCTAPTPPSSTPTSTRRWRTTSTRPTKMSERTVSNGRSSSFTQPAGVCRVAKTKAIDTCDSGPAAGLFGAAFLARMYGLDNVVTVRHRRHKHRRGTGPATANPAARGEGPRRGAREGVGHRNGVHRRRRKLDRQGGCQIEEAHASGRRAPVESRVRPASASAAPTPASPMPGSRLATLIPNYFLGAAKKLDPAKAKAAIKRRAADPLKITEEAAAWAVVDQMTTQCAHLVRSFLDHKGIDPDDATMFAFGGGGGLSCPRIARAAGVGKSLLLPLRRSVLRLRGHLHRHTPRLQRGQETGTDQWQRWRTG